jgi:hypothetical protein
VAEVVEGLVAAHKAEERQDAAHPHAQALDAPLHHWLVSATPSVLVP